MDDLKTLTRRWFEEVWNKRRADAIDELFDVDGPAHGLADDGGPLRGPRRLRSFMRHTPARFRTCGYSWKT